MHALSNRKLNYSVDHYGDALSCKYIGKDTDEVKELAKHTLQLRLALPLHKTEIPLTLLTVQI